MFISRLKTATCELCVHSPWHRKLCQLRQLGTTLWRLAHSFWHNRPGPSQILSALLYPNLLAGCEGSNAETQRARRDAEGKNAFFLLALRPSASSASLR